MEAPPENQEARGGFPPLGGDSAGLQKHSSNSADIATAQGTADKLAAAKPKLKIFTATKGCTLMETANKSKLASAPEQEEDLTIAKPASFDLEKFKSKRAPTIAGVQTLLSALPHHKIAAAKDFVRLHPDEEAYWSSELCFVNVPILGAPRDVTHLIVEDLAMEYLESSLISRHRLALATKPNDKFFLCEVPTRNIDNTWVATNLMACEQAKWSWVRAASRKDEGVDAYKVSLAEDEDAFPQPKWPEQSLSELIRVTFAGRMIDDPNHSGLLRLLGKRQSTS